MRCDRKNKRMVMYCPAIDAPSIFWPCAVCHYYHIPFSFSRDGEKLILRVMMKGVLYHSAYRPITELHTHPLIAASAWCALIARFRSGATYAVWKMPASTLSAAVQTDQCCRLYGLDTILSAHGKSRHYTIACTRESLLKYGKRMARVKGVYPPLTAFMMNLVKHRRNP